MHGRPGAPGSRPARHSCFMCEGQRDPQRFDRRVFLKAASLSMITLGAGGTPSFLGRLIAQANATAMTDRRKTLVAIFQRGGMDGVMAVTPLGDDGLRKLRPGLAMSEAAPDEQRRLIDLGYGFGLHPAFQPLMPFYADGALAIVHGAG